MGTPPDSVSSVVECTGFHGTIQVDLEDGERWAAAYGLADRAHGIPHTVDTRLGIASGTKGFTAVTVVGLVDAGALRLDTTARSVLGPDLPLIADDVTVEHLLGHTSGIGDYYDESIETDISAYLLTCPAHELFSTPAYLRVLDGFPSAFAAGTRFDYCNGGFVVLALIAERVAATPFADLVQERIARPAGMNRTGFLRSDLLPGDAAFGYVRIDGNWHTNAFHLPVLGSGDGGLYTTVADMRSFWTALFDGRLLPERWVEQMTRPRGMETGEAHDYGLGFWLGAGGDRVILTGSDPGVSFRSVYDRLRGISHTTISNTYDGAWPVSKQLDAGYGHAG